MNGSSQLDNAQVWKAKCASLHQELEVKQAKWAKNEKILCRAIIRLALATDGLDQTLDPHLVRIRNLLKKGIQDEKLLEELDCLSENLLRAAHDAVGGRRVPSSALLFGFLKQCALSAEEKRTLTELEERSAQGSFADGSALFDAIGAVLDRESGPVKEKPKLMDRLLGGGFRRFRGETTDYDQICRRLLRLFDELEIPLDFKEQWVTLKERLQKSREPAEVVTLVEESIRILTYIKTFIQKERQEIEGFLGQLTVNLRELEQQALAVNETALASAQDRHTFDSAISEGVEALKLNALESHDLRHLKQMITGRLEMIVDQMRLNKEAENRRRIEMEHQLRELMARLQKMELESEDLRQQLRLAHHEALRDPVTGLPNRLAYDERIKQEFARWHRFHEPLALLVWDIDHFKEINDRFGHQAGDRALRVIARQLADNVRETDFTARYGGEEFVTLLCGTAVDPALKVAEGLRVKIKNCGFNSQGKKISITISCGISQFAPNDTPEDVFARADKALYQAKRQGRDRCVVL